MIAADEIVDVGAAVPGLLKSVRVSRGDVVRKGDVIAEFVSDEEAAAVALARLQAGNDAQLRSARQSAEFQERKLVRTEALNRSAVMTEAQRDEAATEAAVARMAAEEAEQALELARLELKRAEATLALRTVRSPVDGIVVEKVLDAGEYRTEQQHIVTVGRIDPLRVEAYLPVADYGAIAAGDLATVTAEYPFEERHVATVRTIDRIFDAASGTFGVELTLANPGGRLPAGLRCTLRFDGGASAGG